jgi:fructoselysine-6-P-deglycase FrlB-like protein
LGRPFASELDELPATYEWAMTADVRPLAAAISGCLDVPLIAVGSGGSLTVAEFAAKLHRDFTALPSFAETPLDVVAEPMSPANVAVLMTTAGGRNPDVIGSFREVAAKEPRRLVVLCLTAGTPLAQHAKSFPFVDFIELLPPTARDGFLATNSLIASVVLLLRGYSDAVGRSTQIPRTWKKLLAGRTATQIRTQLIPAFQRQTLVVLHGPDTRPAAVDIESKMTEAALGNVWTADYRHFAHGRHHWLAKRGGESAVLALSCDSDRVLAERTLSLLPRDSYVIREDLPFVGSVAALAALARGMYLTDAAGTVAGIDPGRPGVPGFGRKIYHLNAFSARRRSDLVDVAIRRKTGTEPARLPAKQATLWRNACREFVAGLERARFSGLVLDYDGTLCSASARREPLAAAVTKELVRLLTGGIRIGIATGRGKSVRLRLREALPRELWPRVIIGYYNGGDIAPLDDDTRPDGCERTAESLQSVARVLTSDRVLAQLVEFELRLPQIKIEVRRPTDTERAWAVVQQIALAHAPDSSLLRSSHSMDLIAAGVDKRNVVQRLQQLGDKDVGVLCIGDRGRFPGNDYQLLATPYALSVDECSPSLETCWNLAPVGHRGPDACLVYLRSVSLSRGHARVRVHGVSRGRR